MLLRSLSKHVKDQNWFAVALDFLIVVFGIFIGFQLNNWNENRKLDEAYVQARVRLVSETEANISAARQLIASNEASLPVVRGAIAVLKSCSAGREDLEALERGLNQIRGTQSLKLRDTALAALTRDDGLLSRQPEIERERLGEFYRVLIRTQETLNFLERLPFDNLIEDHPAVGMAEVETIRLSEAEWNVLDYRPLTLVVPLDEASKDATFVKQFYRWERVASFQILRARQFEASLAQNLEALGIVDAP